MNLKESKYSTPIYWR